MPLSAKTWKLNLRSPQRRNDGQMSLQQQHRLDTDPTTATLLILKTRLGRCWEEGGRKRRWRLGVRSDFSSDLFVTCTEQRRFPGLCFWRSLIRACCRLLQKLTSYSSMAVDVEVSATKRSQVEVTKILPERTKEKKNKKNPPE